ncbi:MAG: PDZ domain-containing protein, partial [Planctomycetaceae bacterium]|nr:PDZ domain-containing protein [Planctomycetaceae bacterium]
MTQHLSQLSKCFDRFLLPAILVVSLLALSPTVAPAKDLDVELQMGGQKLRAAFQPVVTEARKSTVEIWCGSKHVAMGVVLDNEGHILTKASELQSNITCRFFDETETRAKLLAADREYDLALLEVKHDKLIPIQWADEDLADIGRWVVTTGIEESPIAIGMSSVRSIDIPKVRGKAWLGVVMDVAIDRPKIQSIRPFSSASRSGLRTGDVILQISDKVVESRDHMISALSKFTPGDSLFVRVLRGSDYKNFQITLDKHGKDAFHRQEIQNRMGAKLSNRRAGFTGVMQHSSVMSSHN